MKAYLVTLRLSLEASSKKGATKIFESMVKDGQFDRTNISVEIIKF